MFETLTASQLDTITGGTNDAPLPPPHPGRAASAALSLGSHAKPIAEAQTQKKLPVIWTGGAS